MADKLSTPKSESREEFDAAFIRAIDRQAEMVAHTPGWKPLIDLVWEELHPVWFARSESEPMRAALQMLVAWDANKNGDGFGLSACCEAARKALKVEGP